ncbi:hypothetical protein TPHA_0K00760 [Tetrapisispora phaffii CBS 4417]|uniref:Dol-P-Man:Man(5)GlcNAc(2)-PP-Dol alpha-1,3-mannosyltransferase n=1 Tax=Tetrapisispora phaffii (strain ATCC 24235 / CBS 4417 / NBRC 1672 / NRRL Y-8282 / UCD 70-5) TaxID=1071381 RepID=G8BZ82_TETPH|nr:hypothetical protein TPHA_0K00760 [Tetrapisispora phaffii CBS 4417]CCE65210.1 hypothetical protein TPHA_0K00760 [Tetrapisispora phaffii CBS 4417]
MPNDLSSNKKNNQVQKNGTDKSFVRPPFEPLVDLKDAINFILFNKNAIGIVIFLLIMFESMALKIIVSKIAYTEIDYKAYVEQIEMINDGEYDYSLIRGGTGPLVYPAGHVLIYRFMNYMTSGLDNIGEGQVLFRVLYIATLVLQMMLYYIMELPPWCIVLASLSKRLHSIYVLRLFNDCFTTFFMVLTVLLLTLATRVQNNYLAKLLTFTSSLSYSFAVSIKMNALLYLPAILVAFYLNFDGKFINVIASILLAISWQIVVALPFLKKYPKEYLHSAFEFSRQFMFKWSVNWQMLEEEGFQNKYFHISLLISQTVAIMTVLLSQYPRLLHDITSSILHPFAKNEQLRNNVNIRKFIPFTMIVTNFIGVFFSRSLHYQFLSWYHWTIPLLMHWSRLGVFLGPLWYVAHEYCWNSYPPNSTASSLLFVLNLTMLLLIVAFDRCCNVESDTESKAVEQELESKKKQ